MLIFVQNKKRAVELNAELVYEGVKVEAIHGGVLKETRDDIVKRFREGKLQILITTDLLSRGIDFLKVNFVLNYDFP